jgi:diguanylate cyclase (GGDEF)-like protein
VEAEPISVLWRIQCGGLDLLVASPEDVPPGVLDLALETAELKPWLPIVFLLSDQSQCEAMRASFPSERANIALFAVPQDAAALPTALANCFERASQQPLDDLASMLRGRHREMSILTSTVESALRSGNMGEAIRGLASGLSRLLGAPLLGILEVEEEGCHFSAACRDSVVDGDIESLERELRERYWLVSGKELLLRGDRTISRLPGGGAAEEPLRNRVVPFFTNTELGGCFGVAFPEGQRLTPEQLLFLEYVPTHLSTVFSSLRHVRFMAMHDALTGAYSRLYLEEYLGNRLAGHQRYGSDLSVVMVDLDNFKQINDNFGHPVGDRLLKEFAELLVHVSRDADTVARYGGDEFIVVLDATSTEGAQRFVSRLLADTYSRTFANGLESVDVSVSVGVTTVLGTMPEELLTVDRLLSQADAALYAAKAAGRNCGAVWPGMSIVALDNNVEGEGGAPRGERRKAPRGGEATGVAPETARLLVVDDQPEVLMVVARVLQRAGYSVEQAGGGQTCLEMVKQSSVPYDLVVTDLTMPGMDGLQLLKRIRHLSPQTAGIVLTGYATLENAVSSFQGGVRAFLRKPVDRMELLGAVESALRVQALENENRLYRDELERLVLEKSAQLRQALAETREAFNFAVDGFAALVDMREPMVGFHAQRVRSMSLVIGRKLGFSSRRLDRLARGALLHDIGKVAVPDGILLKRGKLTDEEWAIMRRHPENGYEILRKAPWLEEAAETVRSHHERWDGTGYPRGLKGEEICQEARVFAVADSYDAMRVARVYRPALSREEAVAEITRNSGTQFDPGVVEAFLECVPELEEVIQRSLDETANGQQPVFPAEDSTTEG